MALGLEMELEMVAVKYPTQVTSPDPKMIAADRFPLITDHSNWMDGNQKRLTDNRLTSGHSQKSHPMSA